MVKCKKYVRYKKSGVNYLGDFPNEWDIKPIKYLIKSIQTGTTPTTKNEEYFDGEIKWFTPGDFVGNGELIESSRTISNLAIEDNEAKMFPKNTVAIVGIGATVGKVAKMCVEGSFNQQVTGLVADKEKLYSDYLYYWLDTNKEAIKKIANYTTLPIINNEFIKNYKCYVPNLNEQQQITKFLDQKTSEIDFLIADKEKLITLLEEKRQAVITEVVTKGLNANAKMKDSGVECIGEIPEHWEIHRLKEVCLINPNKSELTINKELEVTFVPMENILSTGVVDTSITKDISEVYNGYTYFREQDIIMAKVTPCFENGNISIVNGLANEIGFGTTELHVLRAKRDINNKFLYYLLQTNRFKIEGIASMYGVAGLKRIPVEFIKNYKFALPNIEEQKEIVEQIDKTTSEINSVNVSIKEQIEKLKDYRQSLISEVVTGKIDVRDYCKEA